MMSKKDEKIVCWRYRLQVAPLMGAHDFPLTVITVCSVNISISCAKTVCLCVTYFSETLYSSYMYYIFNFVAKSDRGQSFENRREMLKKLTLKFCILCSVVWIEIF